MSVEKKAPAQLRIRPQPEPKITGSERKRVAILNAALNFLWTKPFRDMTVRSLTDSTGVGRSAFYQYFNDLHEVMETLLNILQDEIFAAVEPWIGGMGDPVALLHESITGLIRVCYQRGPLVRAIADAATTDKCFEKDWRRFLGRFDDAVSLRIKADQKQGLIPDFDARPVALALNRLDAYTIIEAFGQHPRKPKKPVRQALARIWISTLYGGPWLEKKSPALVREKRTGRSK